MWRRNLIVAAAMLGLAMPLASPATAQISIGVSIRIAPPPLPVYAQPPLPGPDYLWTPGYWAWDDYVEAYFWVPGTWVRAPRPGLLWTPPWWGWSDGLFVFHTGYWGPHIGFYGGVPYGFGYTGVGFQGGYWSGGHVAYNSTVTNITNVHVTNVYQTNVAVNRITRVSYNGGPGGVQARPTYEEQTASRDPHLAPTGNQQVHVMAAHADPKAFMSANHGRPPMLATARPLGSHSSASSYPIPPATRGQFAGSPVQPAYGQTRGASERRLIGVPALPSQGIEGRGFPQPQPVSSTSQIQSRSPDQQARVDAGFGREPGAGQDKQSERQGDFAQLERRDTLPTRPARPDMANRPDRPPERQQMGVPPPFRQVAAPPHPTPPRTHPAPRPAPRPKPPGSHPRSPAHPHNDRCG